MNNLTGKVIKFIGEVIITLGIIAAIIVWIAIADEFNGFAGFAAAVGTVVSTAISGILLIGFSEVIFLLQENLNENKKTSSQLTDENNSKKDELPEL